MMSFEPLWETMKQKGITTYTLTENYKVSRGTLDNLKHNRNVTLITVERMCKILNCKVEEVVVYKENREMENIL